VTALAYRISGRNRLKKWRLFLAEMAPAPQTRVLDVGYSAREFSATDNFIEKHYPYPERLTALGIDPPERFQERYPQVRVVQYAGGVFPFADGEFDVAWSNAVIEHVSGEDERVAFLREIRRVARRAFISTPNRFFPIEPHTRTPLLHYLPKRVFDGYLGLVGKRWARGDYMCLLSLGDLRDHLERAGIRDYRIIKNRWMGFALDFVTIF
jgi:SAM-dependent methyltransferase